MLGRLPEDVLAFYDRAGLLPRDERRDLQLMAGQSSTFWASTTTSRTTPAPERARAPSRSTTPGRPEEDCVFAIAGLFRFVRNPRGRYTDWGWEIDASGLGGAAACASTRCDPDCRST